MCGVAFKHCNGPIGLQSRLGGFADKEFLVKVLRTKVSISRSAHIANKLQQYHVSSTRHLSTTLISHLALEISTACSRGLLCKEAGGLVF